MGRPSKYSEALGLRVQELMASGLAIHKIAERDDMPTERTLFSWAATPDHPFLQHYVRGRERQADRFAEEIVTLADACPADRDSVAKLRAQQWARAWAAGRMAPRKYGEKVQVDQHVTGKVEHAHQHEHTLQADADSLAEILAILAPHVGNGHDAEAEEPKLQ